MAAVSADAGKPRGLRLSGHQQRHHLPEQLRARINAFSSVLFTIAGTVLSLAVGALGEVLDYRVCMTICGLVTMGVCWLTVFRGRAAVKDVLHYQEQT